MRFSMMKAQNKSTNNAIQISWGTHISRNPSCWNLLLKGAVCHYKVTYLNTVSWELGGNVKYSCNCKSAHLNFSLLVSNFKYKSILGPPGTLHLTHILLEVWELTFPVQWKTPSSPVPTGVLTLFCNRSLDKATTTSPHSTVKAHTLRNVPTSRLLLEHSVDTTLDTVNHKHWKIIMKENLQ